MRVTRPWTDADNDTLRDLHGKGLTLTAVAREMGRGKQSVSHYAGKMGLDWDRTRTAAAAQARHVDAKARRAALQLALLEDAERLRRELWQPVQYVDHGGKEFIEVRWTMPTPSYQDRLRIMQTVGTAIDRSLKLADHDSTGADAVRSLLGGIAAQLGIDDTPPAPAA